MKTSLQHREEMHEDAPQFENQTNKNMKGLVITKSGEYVEIINGGLMCVNKRENLETIMDWLSAEDEAFEASIKITKGKVYVDFPETTPTHKMESLLEHFEYQ